MKYNIQGLTKLLGLGMLLLNVSIANAAGYTDHPVAKKWQKQMIEQGIDAQLLKDVLHQARKKTSIIKALNRPAEKRFSWEKYRTNLIDTKRIQNGNKFWNKHNKALLRAEEEFGVPAEIIVSIIGVETRYGKVTGSYRVIDALSTIAFDYPRRSAFFQNELKEFLLLTQEENIPFAQPKGSYAGAMGFGQFIPSSFRAYAIDYDKDGKRDIWKNPVDAIGSVANYFSKHHWKTGDDVILQAKLGGEIGKALYNNGLEPKLSFKEWQSHSVTPKVKVESAEKATLMKFIYDKKDQYWFGLHNFYVITRYNRSRYYAMVVYQLSQLIKAEKKLS